MRKTLIGVAVAVLALTGCAAEADIQEPPDAPPTPAFTTRDQAQLDREAEEAGREYERARKEAERLIEEYNEAQRGIASGTHLVGADIEPGTYRTAGGDGRSCYWERLSGLSGESSDRITNDLGKGQMVVEIQPSDAAFSTRGCLPWEKID